MIFWHCFRKSIHDKSESNLMKTRIFKNQLLASSIIAFGAISIAPSISYAAADGPKEVDTVIVTARKKSEATKDIPISVSAIRGDALTAVTSGAGDMNALSARTPSLVVESSFGRTFPRFYIRGLGNTDFDLNASQPVSLVYDDVVFENPVLKGFPIFDTDRIEVLRGPQGSLFGRNTPAGVVKFDSVKPGQGKPSYLKVGVRSFDGYDADGAYETALGDALSLRVSALYQKQGDYINDLDPAGGTNDLGEFEEKAARIQLRYKPNDSTDANLNIHGRDLTGTSQIFRANAMTKGTRGLNSSFVRDAVYYDDGYGNPQELTTKGANLKIEHILGDLTLTSISAYENLDFYGRGDIDGGSLTKGPGFIPFNSDTADGIDGLDQYSQELRLSSDKSKNLSWQLGAYYFKEDISIYSLAYFSQTGAFSDARQTQETEAWAVFGSTTYKPTDKLAITAGLRYSDESKDLMAKGGITNMAPIYKSTSDNALSWDLSAVYAANKDVNFYGRAARGFRAPAIQGRLLFGTAVTSADSEFVTSFEGGMKATMLDKRIRADISAFAYEIDNQQFTAIGGAGNVNTLINIDKGVAHGLEAEFQFIATDRLSLNLSASYNHTEIQDATAAVAPCGAPCTVLNPVVGGLAKIDGNAFPNAPEVIVDIGAKYVMPLGTGKQLTLTTDWAFKGETNFFLYKSVEFSEDGYWEGGVRAALSLEDGKYEISAYGRNITDTEALVGGIDFNNLTGFVNAPRIWGLEGKVKF
jgi:iron complex outermembrane recepter protein